MSGITRRNFLKSTATGALSSTVTMTTGILASAKQPVPTTTILAYEKLRIATLDELRVGQPLEFLYPDAASPCILLKLGKPAPGGVGPDGDIVAYSSRCTHLGCPLRFEQSTLTLKCPCHYSIFDVELRGQMVVGQATENLPQVTLAFDQTTGFIHALSVTGLIYGRQSNIL